MARDLARLLIASLATSAALAFTGCDDPQAGWEPADRPFRGYRDVYPILLRDCGFHACHGAPDRFFRVYGPGRARLEDDTRAYEAVTGDELSLSYSLALSMIDAEHPERSPLLQKPLAIEVGGAHHGGLDDFGRDVYRTARDEGYLVLRRWVLALPDED